MIFLLLTHQISSKTKNLFDMNLNLKRILIANLQEEFVAYEKNFCPLLVRHCILFYLFFKSVFLEGTQPQLGLNLKKRYLNHLILLYEFLIHQICSRNALCYDPFSININSNYKTR